MLNNFFFICVDHFVCDISGFLNDLVWSFWEWLYFFETPFCVVKLGIKTNVPIFKSVAGLKREIIGYLCFVFVAIFLLFFDKFFCVFYPYLKSTRYGYRKLILKIVVDKSGLHHGYVVVDYNKMNLCLVDNKLLHFYGRLL